MIKLTIIIYALLIPLITFSQVNGEGPVIEYPATLDSSEYTPEEILEQTAKMIDTLNLRVRDVVITGNDITKDVVILREMSLKKGSIFTYNKYTSDLQNIYNTRLFPKVDIIPIPVNDSQVVLNVDVTERFLYITPLPTGGIDDGEWKKIWVDVSTRWDNFRGMNETINFNFRLFYNPRVSLGYSNPWIGKNLKLFMSIGGSWSRTRNQNLSTVGRENGTNALTFEDENYQNTQYSGNLSIGKKFGKNFSVFTDYAYNFLRVNEYQPGRTVSPTGVDKYLTIGGGMQYDTRNNLDYTTKGIYLKSYYQRHGFLDKQINFGRFTFEGESFIPVNITDNYFLTVASRLYTSLAVGAVIPSYHHKTLGYSDDYVRGWKGLAYEGDDVFTLYNELRIPIVKPRYIKASKIPLLKSLPVIKDLPLKYGLYFTLIYDIGTTWFKNDRLADKRFLSGAGVGLNLIAPFGYVFRLDWVFRMAKPSVGEINLRANAKF